MISTNLSVFVTHPVQYHVPIWRALSKAQGVNTFVHYFSDRGVTDRLDRDFGVSFQWDGNLLDGYKSSFLSRSPLEDVHQCKIQNLPIHVSRYGFNWVLLHGYTQAFARQLIINKKIFRYKVALRGEFCDLSQRFGIKRVFRETYLRWFYSKVDAFCYVGQKALFHLKNRGIKEDRLFFSPYNVDTELFERQYIEKTREERRSALGIKPDQIVVLFSGKMIDRKQPLMIASLAKHFQNSERLITIMLGDGPLFESVSNELSELVNQRKVILPGFVNQSRLGDYFGAADLFLFPSKFDTWGLVANEAMQFGLPCFVSNRVGCADDLVEEGRTGHVFQWDSFPQLVKLVEATLQNQVSLVSMGAFAREKIKCYSCEAATNGILRAIGCDQNFNLIQ